MTDGCGAVHRGLVERMVATTVPGRTARLLPFVEPDVCLVAIGEQPETDDATV